MRRFSQQKKREKEKYSKNLGSSIFASSCCRGSISIVIRIEKHRPTFRCICTRCHSRCHRCRCGSEEKYLKNLGSIFASSCCRGSISIVTRIEKHRPTFRCSCTRCYSRWWCTWRTWPTWSTCTS